MFAVNTNLPPPPLPAECIPASIGNVFPLYCAMSHDRTLRHICTEHNMQALRVNERKLVQFGLLRGLIRRVHKVGRTRGVGVWCIGCMVV